MPSVPSQDALVNQKVCGVERVEGVLVDMILEGGSIEVDGQGTLITTEECLLHPSRNPGMTKVGASADALECRGQCRWPGLPEGGAISYCPCLGPRVCVCAPPPLPNPIAGRH
jgi:agmatine/peptidylarginine deiminase